MWTEQALFTNWLTLKGHPRQPLWACTWGGVGGGGGLSYALCLWQSYCSNMSGSGDVGRKGVGGSSPTLSWLCLWESYCSNTLGSGEWEGEVGWGAGPALCLWERNCSNTLGSGEWEGEVGWGAGPALCLWERNCSITLGSGHACRKGTAALP